MESIHLNVNCDGCGKGPIQGVRYKCTVCKNFDYCETCEATKDHPHAFLKIHEHGQAPKAIYTVINEDMPAKEVDGEVDQKELKVEEKKKLTPEMLAAGMIKWSECIAEWGQKAISEQQNVTNLVRLEEIAQMDPETMR